MTPQKPIPRRTRADSQGGAAMSARAGGMSRDLRLYTSYELATGAKLKASGVPIAAIAERLGRSPTGLQSTLLRPPKIPADVRLRTTELIIEEYAAGKRIRDIAAARGWSSQRVIFRMNRAGVDGEVRAMIRGAAT